MPPMRIRPIPFPEFRDEVLRLYDPPHRATATRRQIRYVLEQVAALQVKTTADLTPVLVARFVESRPPGQSPRTLQTLLRVLRGVCNNAVINGYLRVSQFALRRVSQWLGRIGPPAEKKHYSRDEIRLEARFIALTDRGRDGGYRLKTPGSEQPVPIPEALVPILTDWLSHRLDAPVDFPIPLDFPWLFPTLNRRSNWTSGPPGTKPVQRLQAVGKRAGVEGLTLLALRHSWATHAE